MRRHRLGFVVNIRYFDVGDDAVETSARVMCEARVMWVFGVITPSVVVVVFVYSRQQREKQENKSTARRNGCC